MLMLLWRGVSTLLVGFDIVWYYMVEAKKGKIDKVEDAVEEINEVELNS